MDRRGWKAASAFALLLAGSGCTPTVTLRSGAEYDQAKTVAERYCAAIIAPGAGGERELFSEELRRHFDEAGGNQRERFLTSVGRPPTCVPGKIEAFGRPPQTISIDARIRAGGATDTLHLRRDGGLWRIDDVVYGRPPAVGTVEP